MKLAELIQIDKDRIKRSEDIKVELKWNKIVTYNQNLFKKFWRIITRRNIVLVHNLYKFEVTNKSNGNVNILYLEIEPQKSLNKIMSSRVKVFCQCADFKFRSAYILNQEDNLFRSPKLDEHLGIALTVPPTKIIPTPVCKHVYAMIDYVRNHLTKLDLIIT